MAEMYNKFYDWFWNEEFWLGDNNKWQDLVSDDPAVYYPKVSHMNYAVFGGLLLLVVRKLWVTLLINPLGRALGMRERRQIHLAPQPPLEAYYRRVGWRVAQPDMQGLVKQTDLTPRQVERWLFKRRVREMPSDFYKFRECSYQVLVYSTSFCWGVYALWDKPWLWKTVNCWVGWPKQHIDPEVFIFYFVELSVYWSLLFATLFGSDYKKKDKKEMVLHHLITILLLYFSWAVNMVRIGTLVLVVHDVADPCLNVAKMGKYAKIQKPSEALFIVFVILWVLSRCVVYPLWVLNCSAVEIYDYFKTFPAYWFFNGLLFLLQFLHIIWTYLILSVAFTKLSTGSIEKDLRSESDAEISDSPEEENGKEGKSDNHSYQNVNEPQDIVREKD